MPPATLFFYALLVMCPALLVAQEDPAQKDAAISLARSIVKETQSQLQSALQQAMQKDGPAGAIGVCTISALPITMAVAEKHGADVKRTGTKLRNPANSPDEWERSQLDDFAARAAKGEALATMESSATINGKLRYMKAIPMGGVCAACHGPSVTPALYEKIKSLYPNDQATGFAPGSLRGAYSVSLPLSAVKTD